MSMTAKKLLDRAEELGMLDPKVIEELRRQVAGSKFQVSAEAIVKVLVDKKHLTQFQAKKLVSEVTTEPEVPPTPKSASSTQKQSPLAADDDDLLLLDDTPSPGRAPSPIDEDEDEIVDLEAALPPAEPLKAAVKPITPAKTTKAPAKAAAPPPNEGIITLEPAEEAPKPAKPSKPMKAPASLPKETAPAPSPGLTPLSGPPGSPPAPIGLSPLGPSLSPLNAPQAPVRPAGLGPAPAMPDLAPLGPLSPGLGSLGPHDPLLGGSLDPLGGPTPPPQEEAKVALKKKHKRGWDSPLLLLGGGGLGILLIAFVVLYFALTRGSAQEIYEEANEKYRSGAYATAISLYQKFASKYPEDPNVSAARVKIGMSRLHQDYDGQKDMGRALKTAQQVLPEIAKESNFDDARSELESMLPSIADSFASTAKATTDRKRAEEQVELAEKALELVNNATYLPSSRRQNQQARLDSILEKVHVAKRMINQDKALAKAIGELQDKLKAGEIVAAYNVREDLLQEYPTLEKHPDVVKNTLAISQRERDLVVVSPESKAAATDDPQAATHPQVVLASRTGDPISAAADETVFLLIREMVFAIGIADGKMRWRRYLGASKTQPLPVEGGDVVVADDARQELLRLQGADGKLIWRQSLGESFAAPQLVGDYLLVTLASGRVVRIDAGSGEIDRSAQLPQRANVAGGIDTRAKILYQPGEHSTIFALAGDDSAGEPLACQAAYYLGHDAGSIATPPVVAVGHVFVFENTGADSCLVHALARDEKGNLSEVREPFSLRGRITVPPSHSGPRVVVVTDLGDTLVIDVNPSNTASPVNVTAQMVGGLSQPAQCFHALSGSQLFIADNRLAEYEIVATRQSLDRGKSSFDRDAFVAPLQLMGSTLIHARQRQGANSITVMGTNLDDNKMWQLTLAATLPAVYAYMEEKQFTAISSDGNLYDVPSSAFQEGVRDQPTAAAGGPFAQSYQAPVSLPGDRSLVLDRAGQKWLLYTSQPGGSMRRVDVQAPEAISARPLPFAGGVLTPLAGGSIWLMDPETGAPLAETTPLQPEIAPGATVKWLPPVAVDERQFVAIDAARRILLLARREEKPMPFLAESRQVDLDFEPVSAAISGRTLFVAARGSAEDQIVPYALPSLEKGAAIKIGGRIGWRGLEVGGDGLFCETIAGEEVELVRLSSGGDILWRAKMKGRLACTPLPSGSNWVVVSQAGGVALVQGETGKTTQGAGSDVPITGGVQLFGARIVAGGVDGALHILPVPAAN